ncbi:hypothetical protein DPMN_040414 [Dreissena polymorpha]|uniref:Uncharacterized protein n=1 Tax=Dreissena polymorpha TaxID=45954 RepID=A0A9D4HT16_DREPO|nr:hypothetical protein DPMN_040414 [Dreissena polymorpha]
MGGVDRMDQNVGIYQVEIRSKKWWWPVFAYCLDLAFQQTWHLYRATPAGREQPLDLLGIRSAIVKVFLACGQQQANRGRTKSRSTALNRQVLDTLPLVKKDHYVTQSKQ